MLICVIAFIAFVGMVGVNFLNINKKIYIMASIIVLLLLLHIIDQFIEPQSRISAKTSNYQQLNITQELYKNSPSISLLKEEKQLLNYLLQKYEQKHNIILRLDNIDSSRLRGVFKHFQQKTQVPALEINFEACEYFQVEQTLEKVNSDIMVYLLVQNLNKISAFHILQNVYLSHNVSIIMKDPHQLVLPISSLSNWMDHYHFQDNYVSQILQNHPPRLVQICSQYRTFNYPFYVLSKTQSIPELCTKFPSTSVTQCIRQFLEKEGDRVWFSKVKHCWKGEVSLEGVLIQNGRVGVKKDYYYGGIEDKKIFSEGDLKH